jgi:alkylhydroperoxidase family enzyme
MMPMPWIRTIAPGEATGLLKRLYDEAVARAGKVFNVLRIQSLRPEVLEAGLGLYQELMFSLRSPLSRAQREMIAVAVSRANECHY